MNNKIQEIKNEIGLMKEMIENNKSNIPTLLTNIEYLLSEYDRMKEALEQISNTTISQYTNLKEMIVGIKLTASRALEEGGNE